MFYCCSYVNLNFITNAASVNNICIIGYNAYKSHIQIWNMK